MHEVAPKSAAQPPRTPFRKRLHAMPSASDFKRAFALEPGARVAGATVEAAAVGHEQLRRQALYRYPGEVTLKLPARGHAPAARALAAEFKRRVGEKMVNLGENERRAQKFRALAGASSACRARATAI